MSKAGKRLLAAASEAAAIARGEASAAHIHVPADIDVRAIRRKTTLSQEDFAGQFGFTIAQIRDWEQARHRPIGAHRAYLMLIDRDPDAVRVALGEVMNASRRKAA
eukprot:TRINITY_DN6830_c0_g1_i1.p3 TRINITY_DN6830_c0_g1~~TRINITY_DN6830_c0_g1_i1.p3  ORF type:complete len:106 (+),score=19.30 TRINITY_DN6830_c0_g1_i1:399-716(+)